MIFYRLASGCSAVRLARLLREQEVAGSIPVTPTIFIMTRRLLRYTTSIFITLYCIMAVSCTPSPRYRGGTGNRSSGTGTQDRPSGPAPAEVDIVLRYPLGGTGGGRISSPFGMRTHPSYGTQEFHQGVDFEAETGDDVFAAAAGRVSYAGRQKGYGKVVIIDHGRDISSVYAHLSSTAVHRGDTVESGQRIGKVGVSGNATGAHLHFELRVSGNAVDPLDYMEIR
jgi:murein DD-endopeptidase MepM/ murein hydrolase activator NlpD